MIRQRTSKAVTVIICLLLLTLAFSGMDTITVAGSALEVPSNLGASVPPSTSPISRPTVQSQTNSTVPSLPCYGEQEYLFTINETGPYEYESPVTIADFNGDNLEDAVLSKSTFQTFETYELDILLNDGNGSLKLGTSSIYSGTVPVVQNPREVVTADFNGDSISDFFVADHGYDAHPFPGYQNTLILTAPDGKLVDATSNLPQQDTFTHSACAADIDGDKDIDLYVGHFWGQNDIDPQLLLNDGTGKFTIGQNRLPPLIDLNQNGYTTCALSDVNDDKAPDLILGDAGDEISNEHSTPVSEVLLNDGTGVFDLLPNAMPAKSISKHDIAHDIEPVHLNDDAFIDLLIVYEGWLGPGKDWQGSYIQTLVNNGDGTFRDETQTRLEPLNRQVWITALWLRDLDNDGDLDLLAKHDDYLDPDPVLFINDGRGRFSKQPLDFKLTSLYFNFLDLEGDNGHDLVMVTFAPPDDVYVIRDRGCPVFLPGAYNNYSNTNN